MENYMEVSSDELNVFLRTGLKGWAFSLTKFDNLELLLEAVHGKPKHDRITLAGVYGVSRNNGNVGLYHLNDGWLDAIGISRDRLILRFYYPKADVRSS